LFDQRQACRQNRGEGQKEAAELGANDHSRDGGDERDTGPKDKANPKVAARDGPDLRPLKADRLAVVAQQELAFHRSATEHQVKAPATISQASHDRIEPSKAWRRSMR